MAVLATDASDVGHVPAVSADGQSAFASNLALLLRAHGRKAASALLLAAAGRAGGATSALPTVGGAPGLSASPTAPLRALFVIIIHTAAAAG
jgi:hypothetical protein